MIVLPRSDGRPHKCQCCRQAMGPGDHFHGSRMWHYEDPICGHEAFILCPKCYLEHSEQGCPVCGCQVFYC
jgi:hypothetical protein